jgi:hypothetical protein
MGEMKQLKFEKKEIKLPDGRKEIFYSFPKNENLNEAKKEKRQKKNVGVEMESHS